MRESSNVALLVANLVQTEPNSHMFFRAYGVTAIDSNRAPTRGAISVQCARWYPDVRLGRVNVKGVTNEGHWDLEINLV